MRVTFPSNGGTADGYLALPASGSGPGVVVIQEYWGLVGHITDVADRFAAEGFVALAPDLYHGLVAREPDEAVKLLMGLAMDRAARHTAGAAASLAGRDETTGSAAGTVGFCMGGSLALWSATLSDRIAATVGFYPPMPWERMRPEWDRYAGKKAQIHCDEADGTSAAPGIQQAVRAVEAAGGEVEVYDYPGTHHAFFNDERPESYDREASEAAWGRTIRFLRDSLS